MITPNGVMDILKEYLEENPEIQKELDIESLNLNETYFQSIVQELADALYEAGGEATKSPGNLFAYSTAEEYSSWDYPIRTKIKNRWDQCCKRNYHDRPSFITKR